MITPPGYRIVEQLHESEKSLVYRAEAPLDGAREPVSVILKVFRTPNPSPQDIGRFKREYAIAQRFDHPGIVRPHALTHADGHWMLVLGDSHGDSLDKLLDSRQHDDGDIAIDLNTVFDIALQLCDALDAVHAAHVIHKDINPSNLIWNPARRQLQITDFGISSELGLETPLIQSPHVLEGTLPYMSPEQTGRMNRVVDYRADYYALGVTLYELLSGQRPFRADDAMELVHCHMARTPDWSLPAFQRLPPQLVAVLQRLLEKNAEQRYQTLHGLRRDLELCRALTTAPADPHAALGGLSDRSGVFQIPQKLYGREAEIEALLAAFDRVSNGPSEMVLVAGYSGIGKSAVVGEVHKPIVARRGYFVSGKFDQYKRNIPYASLIQALQELIRQLLTEPQAQVQEWAAKLQQALGANAGVIAELIPELQLIVGATEPVVPLPPAESQNRLNRLFQRFVQVFSGPDHPLVVFLDDLQWADAPTLKLIELFMRDPADRYMLFIGAYRDNEVDAAHPLMALSDTLQQHGVRLDTLTLAPLQETHVVELVADTLRVTPDACRPLADLCQRKTAGNPFFLSQFLKSIHDAGFLRYDFQADHWRWEMAALDNADFTDNVVELMIGRIRRLPDETQNLLQLAASIGNRFDLETLAVVSLQSPYRTQQQLWPALEADLIRPADDRYKYVAEDDDAPQVHYRFLHDRVQQAAYALADDPEKQRRHLAIGRLIYRCSGEEAREERLFAIVEQLNAGRALIDDPAERLQLARLNHRAGLKARTSAAYQAALRHMQIGLSQLPDDRWQREFGLTLDLHLGAAEAAYLSGEFGTAEAIYPDALAHCQTPLDQIRCYSVQVGQYQLQGRFLEAIDIQRKGLGLLGIVIPEDEATLQAIVADGFAEVARLSAGRTMADIMNAPEMAGAEDLAAMQLLLGMSFASYLAGVPTLYAVSVLTMTQLSLRQGNCDISSFAYVLYAFIVALLTQQHRVGFEFGTMAVDLSNRRTNLSTRCSTHFLFAVFTNHWHRHLKTCDPYYDDAFGWGLESGDFATVGYIVAVRSTDRVIQGQFLPDLLQAVERDVLLLRSTGQVDMVDCTRVGAVQSIKNLMGQTHGDDSYDDDAFSEAAFLSAYAAAPLHLAYYYHGKIRNAYLFDTVQATVLADKLSVVEQFVAGQCKVAEATFYAALIWIRALQRNGGRPDAAALREKFDALQARLAGWAELCPDNYAAKYLLTEAEDARFRGDVLTAIARYREAIDAARDTGYVNVEALANERCGEFWREQRQDRVAEVFLRDALHLYRAWGADGKAAQMLAHHPWLQDPAAAPAVRTRTRTRTSTAAASTSIESLDLASILKASHALSSEIGLRRVLERMMEIVRENSGAQSARLLLHSSDGWNLEADLSGESTTVLQSQPVSLDAPQSDLFPLSLLRYVARTGEEVVEDAITASANFAADPYVLAHQPKSVMCLPIKRAAQVTGIIYLENNLTVGSFTHERVGFLRVLAVQAIISIDHARLHDNLERQVAERTAHLNQVLLEQQAILDNTLIGISFIRDRTIQRCNRGFELLFGWEPGELVGKPTRVLYATDEEHEASGAESYPLIAAGQAYIGDVKFVRKDGTPIWCADHGKALDPHDLSKGTVWAALDITDRKEAEQALAELTHQAEEATQSKSLFLANMSHEIRTPMNAIMGMSRLALKTDLNRKQRDYVDKIFSSANSLLRILNDILDFSKVEAGRLTLEQIKFNLVEVLANVSATVSLKAQAKGLELLFSVGADVPRVLVGDPLRLGQVIINLANNAVKFTDAGEILLGVRCDSQDAGRAVVRFSIRDTGVGIPQDRLAALFTPFSQADESTTRKYGGTGLGLAISKQLVELMGGSIWAESEPGRGSEFHFTVALGLDAAAEQRCPVVDPLQGARALVVDDNATARTVLIELLSQMGMRADAAGSGEQALAMVSAADAGGDPYKLLLVDWNMPGLDGVETARQLKADTTLTSPLAILMVTAYNYEDLAALAENAGIDQVLTKPVNESTLHDAIVEALMGSEVLVQRQQARTEQEISETDLVRLRGARVLLVEDSPLNRQVALEFLSDVEAEVDVAVNGRDAIERIGNHAYDLVLMDIQMPEMDGLTATRALRADPRHAELPIIAMTAHAMGGDRELSLVAGMNDHVTKPIDPAELYAAMARWVRRRRGGEPLARAASTVDAPAPAEPGAPFSPLAAHGIDVAAGLANHLGRAAFYQKILGMFAAQFSDVPQQMVRMLDDGQQVEVFRLLHNLKSGAASIGATSLATLAEAAEREARKALPSQEGVAPLLAELARVVRVLSDIVGTAPYPTVGTPQQAAAEPLLRSLAALLAADDATSLDLIEPIEHALAGSPYTGEARAIADLVVDIEYEQARARVETLLQALRG